MINGFKDLRERRGLPEVGISRSRGKQLIEMGVRINTACPVPTWTPFEVSGGLKQKTIPENGSGSRMNRVAQPFEIAGVDVFPASEETSFVTGAFYGVYSGMYTD